MSPMEISGERLWQFFQSRDTNPKNDYTKDGKTYAYMTADEAAEFFQDQNIPYSYYAYSIATKGSRGLSGTGFIRYLQILNNQKPKGLARNDVLNVDENAPFRTNILDGKLQFRNSSSSRGAYDHLDSVVTTPRYTILPEWEAGNFYCEHAGFILNDEAQKPDSSILKVQGEPLVGFMHVPACNDNKNDPDRFNASIEVLSLIVRGYYNALKNNSATRDNMRMLISGFEGWGGANSEYSINLTGDCVSLGTNINRIMAQAFGSKLLKKVAVQIDTPAGPAFRYFIKETPDSPAVPLDILAKIFPVNDRMLDGGSQSLQKVLKDFKPHAVAAMGMSKGSTKDFRISTGLDNTNLKRTSTGFRRDELEWQPTEAYINFSMERAVKSGWDTASSFA